MWGRKDKDAELESIDELLNEEDQGGFSSKVVATLEKAVKVQSGTVIRYVNNLAKKNPDASPERIQELIDRHFMTVVSGSGAGAGASAAVPGVGLFLGMATVSAESVVFLEAAAWYILASAHLRGIDIRDAERRRVIVLLVLTGSKGSALADAFLSQEGKLPALKSATSLSRFSGQSLSGLNAHLLRLFTRQASRKLGWAWVSKLIPLGIGAVLGTLANRKLGKRVVNHAEEQLPPLPSSWPNDAIESSAEKSED